jgi:hypothetical protein
MGVTLAVFPALIFGSSSISVSWFLFLLTPPRELMYGVISINGVRSRRFYRPQNRGERIHNVVVSPYGAAIYGCVPCCGPPPNASLATSSCPLLVFFENLTCRNFTILLRFIRFLHVSHTQNIVSCYAELKPI